MLQLIKVGISKFLCDRLDVLQAVISNLSQTEEKKNKTKYDQLVLLHYFETDFIKCLLPSAIRHLKVICEPEDFVWKY